MIESDHSDKESQDEMPPLEVSTDSVNEREGTQKRLREENSEEDSFHLPVKKLCTSMDNTDSEGIKSESVCATNGTAVTKDIPDHACITENAERDETSSEERKKSESKTAAETSDVRNSDADIKKENKSDALASIKQEEQISAQSVQTVADAKDGTVKEQKNECGNDDVELKLKHKKLQMEDPEVVEGLELSVECASDKVSSSPSDSEDDREKKKPIAKTIIVKAKPNDSELDASSSSEGEKTDSRDVSDTKVKDSVKKGRKRGRTSFSKTKSTDSEENDDDVSDEDYSPRTKRKLKNKKSVKSPVESKRGRGRGKKLTRKPIEMEEEEDENSNIAEEERPEENVSDVESSKTRSHDENDSEDANRDENGKGRGRKPEEDNKKIQLLKKYIRLTGIHVKSYNDLWANCKSNAARVRCLKELLEKNGVSGRPTVEKCKKAKERNERLKDIAELNTSNIISEGRVTRAQRNKEPTKSPETPVKRGTYKRVLSVVDSDSE